METFLREWRQDALNKHQYDAAIFVGDKLLALTRVFPSLFALNTPVLIISQRTTKMHSGLHRSISRPGTIREPRAFLSRQDLVARNPSCRYLAAHCYIKQGSFEEALSVLGEKNPTHLILSARNNRRKLQHTSGHSRAGSTQHGKGPGRLDRHSRQDESGEEDAANIKFEAAMCFLRGLCYAKQNAFDRAKECYKDAVRIDVQCFEAFEQLMRNSLMSPEEEWRFLESLDFDTISVPGDPSSSHEAAEFTKMLYTTRLSKYKSPAAFTAATETLSTHYNLADNADLLLSKADLLFTQCRFKDALAITSSILEDDKYNFSIYPLHLACLYELGLKNALFLVSHDLADNHPEEPCTWLAVGTYYLHINKVAEARRYFSKASMMDPHFGPAWIGFAHTFAAEGEHDQAISAYSTAARLFMGTHLPQLFLGMQNHVLNNMTLADEFLKTAYGLCKTDPLLLNEMGVVFYHQERLAEAVTIFTKALAIADEIDSDPHVWIWTRSNLGHAYRRLQQWDLALQEFDEVLRQGGKDPAVFCSKGLVLMEQKRPYEAVQVFHEALAIHPQDAIATELLNKALMETASGGPNGGEELEDDDEFEKELTVRKADAARILAQKKASKGKGKSSSRLSSDTGIGGEGGSLMDLSDDD